ncbi:MAG: magnesium transporter [Longibaculum muris]|uniref:Magnesium transporter MgtE n=1 Tax=Longibaculum muris TaxID=1796628 RepID=A0A4R3Z0G0_9FIRM|nr:magnesium transporter [Longibaculum muris]KXU52505.1 magnesium transporter [Candidatus Stoquefichus sp. KLE1796]MBS5368637.1 magnesium transporter [Coprobacillus cateniformis]MCR1888571.1 magnesium transporter [Longibaculum muris]MED9810698.1 magnesium transporter [Longibaculum muris]TCV98426.1 magnesium transporter [Longibaculum muris]
MEKRIEELENQIKDLLNDKKYHQIRELLVDLNEADIAEIIETIDNKEDVVRIFRLLPKDSAADVFSYIPVEYEQMIIESLTNREIGQIMNDLYSDDAVDMLEEMPANVVKKVLAATDKETRRDINSLLKYPEDSAGSIMTVEYVDLRAYMSVSDAIDRIRQTGVDKETINTCYVTDAQKHLLGIVTLREIILAKTDENIKDLMTENVITFHTLDDQEEVAKQFQKYDFGAMPVVDNENRLVGIITVDDVMDILEEEATEDIEMMAAITPTDQPYMKTSVFDTYKKRIPWLLLLMISASITGKIIQGFETALSTYVILTAFIPMLMDTGGNCGSQASVSVIRALSLDEVEFKELPLVVWKEMKVSILVGATLAIANFAKIMLIDQTSMLVAFVVCMTLFVTVVVAKFVGCTLPILADKIGFDPAVMASPFITTIVDALSLLVYFNVAGAFLGI